MKTVLKQIVMAAAFLFLFCTTTWAAEQKDTSHNPQITRIDVTDRGLAINWTTVPGMDRYALYRADDNGQLSCVIVADEGKAPEKLPQSIGEITDPATGQLMDNGVIPTSITAAQPVTGTDGNISGYSFTDSLVTPGKFYRYYVLGYSSAEKTWSDVDRNGAEASWTIPANQIRAGTQLTEEAVQALGEDSFFYVEEISDYVYDRMWKKSYKEYCTVPREDLRYIRCLHKTQDGQIKVGELVMSSLVADSVCGIFRQLYDSSYPIESMLLVDDFDASDEFSIMHDNTSAFNYRTVDNTDQISDHAYGLAIDINPYYNVYYIPTENYVFPPKGWDYLDRNADFPYKVAENDLCFRLFQEAGFSWGGWFTYNIDYQHFYYQR